MNRTTLAVLAAVLLWGCGPSEREAAQGEQEEAGAPQPEHTTTEVRETAVREAYFGDLHVHTALSIDAYITNTRTMPDDAYRYAQGEAIDHVSGERIRIDRPLDFMAVTDHSELLGVARAMGDPSSPLSESELAEEITSEDYETSHRAFRRIVAAATEGRAEEVLPLEQAAQVVRSSWQRVIDAAERHNRPGEFTTFVAYEWTSMPNFANLHRNVVFEGGDVPPAPFSSNESNRPEDLWTHLGEWRGRGSDAIAIPHNSNASKGLMFPLEDSSGAPVDVDYARRRRENEPVVEVTQFKGTSEIHPALTEVDEFADFEIWSTVVGGTAEVEPVPGSYVRTAYLRGLELAAGEAPGANPYVFGMIGSSDSHNSSTAVDEANFTGGHGNADATAEARLQGEASTLTTSPVNFSASGLAGVWAEANTREAIFAALRRRETFATSGPRIRVRFFAGTALPEDLLERDDALEVAYARGVPMGGRLPLEDERPPRFLVMAVRDPESARLQRVQVVKGWVEDGEQHQRIYDVACAGGREPDPRTRRCPASEATVDLTDCSARAEHGAAQLAALWEDPDHGAGERAFYYVRALQNPTCRWSTWDAIRLGVEPPGNVPATIQERAWSSPIWLAPAS